MADNVRFAQRAAAASRMRQWIGMELRKFKKEIQQRERWQSQYRGHHGERCDAYDMFLREAREKMALLRGALAAGRKPKNGKA